ncbi:MAG: hypothetical protein WB511_01105 [Nitrososphaeraceae archaeon]
MGVALSIIFRVPGKKDDKLRSREKDIKIHSNKLIQEFKVSKSKLETEEKGWLTFFDKYKYTLEFEQHLSTGRNELFLSLDKFRIIELIYENLRYALERDLLDRLTAKCRVRDKPTTNGNCSNI